MKIMQNIWLAVAAPLVVWGFVIGVLLLSNVR